MNDELEVGEVEGKYLFSNFEENERKYPHGVYQCNCGKRFHGHWNRTLHYASCPKRVRTKPVDETELRTWYCSLGHVEGMMKYTATCPICAYKLIPSILPPLITFRRIPLMTGLRRMR